MKEISDSDISGPLGPTPLDPTFTPDNHKPAVGPPKTEDLQTPATHGLPPVHRFETAKTVMLAGQKTVPLPTRTDLLNLRQGVAEAFSFANSGKYEYLGDIGRGGMGRVVSVRDRSLRRNVAMKLLIAKRGRPSRNQVNRLLLEAQTTGQLEHPNIVPIHDIGINDEDNYYFTMKQVKGTTLKSVFRRLSEGDPETASEYSLPRLLAIFQQIANGLGFAHARGVIHRDLKPDNIMIGEFGEVLIMDWGIAKLIGPRKAAFSHSGEKQPDGYQTDEFRGIETQEQERTVAGTVAGTLGYMSPEQARGAVDELNARTDIFSLGAMLYEMLAGSPPYNQPTERERLLASARGEEIEKPGVRLRRTDANRAARIPREVAAVAMKATAHNPADRYQSAREFFDDIQRYLEGHSVSAAPDTLIQRARKWTRRNRVVVAWILAIICAVGIAIVGARLLIHRSMIKGYTNEGQQILSHAQAQREKEIQLTTQAKASDDSYADLNTQRALDKIDEKYAAQLGQAAEYYSRVFDYDPANTEARAKLSEIYLDMWRSAQRRNKPELMNAFAKEVARYAGPESYAAHFKSEIDGDGKLHLRSGDVQAEVFIFRYLETGKWNRLTPVPYRLAERRVDDSALEEASAKLRLAADGRNGDSLYFLSFNEHYGHDLGRTPLSLEQIPAGSYLLLLRAPGYEDLRFPVNLPRQKDLDVNVRMLKIGERPADFSYIPYVWAKVGGPAAGTKWPNYTWKAVTPFFIQTYEVTFGEYEVFLKDLIVQGRANEARQHLPKDFGFNYLNISGSEVKPHEKLTEGWRKWPVRGVSWLDAQAFASWRSAKERVTYRLPTDLEWEVAARGADGRCYTWGENFWPQAARLSQGYGGLSNIEADSLRRNGQFADESVFGVWDMTGSQAEWCADDFSGREGERVLRGNAWALQPVGLEAAFRTSGPPDYFHSTTGFRLARDLR